MCLLNENVINDSFVDIEVLDQNPTMKSSIRSSGSLLRGITDKVSAVSCGDAT